MASPATAVLSLESNLSTPSASPPTAEAVAHCAGNALVDLANAATRSAGLATVCCAGYHSLPPSGMSSWAHSVLSLLHGVACAVEEDGALPRSKVGDACARCFARFARAKGKPRWIESGRGLERVCESCRNKHNREQAEQQQTPPRLQQQQQQQQQSAPRCIRSAPLNFTPERVDHLTQTMKAAGFGQQGRTRSAPENARALLHVRSLLGLQPKHSIVRSLSFDVVMKTVADAEIMSPTTLRQVARRYVQSGQLTPLKPDRIHIDHPQHMLFGVTGPPLEVQTIIHECIREAAEENIYISLKTIRARIYTTIDALIPRSTLHHWMKKMSLEYGKKKLSGLKAKYARALIRSYILEYSRLKREEELGNCVLVWMDESYIHAGYCSRFSWHAPTDWKVPTKNRVRGCEKGKRLIIIHAMTKDGMLEKYGAEPSDNLDEKCPSAAVVTNKLSAEGYEPEDYHDTLNGEKFLQWMRHRLIPAFQARYPRKKMILILDNAKYHHCRGEDWVSPNKMKKTELGVFLRMAGVQSIKMNDGREIPASKFTADARGAAGGGPTAKKLKEVVTDYVKSHPGINTTLVEQLMQQHKFELLYTPPYESWLQPIELVWARVKHDVATQSKVGRTWQETAEQTKVALRKVTKELCQKIIRHTEDMMNNWMSSGEGGSLKAYQSICALGRLTKAEREKITDLHLVDTLLTGDVNEEPETAVDEED